MIRNPQVASPAFRGDSLSWISLAYCRRQKATVASKVTMQKKPPSYGTIFTYNLKAFIWSALSLILKSLARQNLQSFHTDKHTERLRVWPSMLSASHLHTRQGERLYISYSLGSTTSSNFVYLGTWLLTLVSISKILWCSLQGCETESTIDVLNKSNSKVYQLIYCIW